MPNLAHDFLRCWNASEFLRRDRSQIFRRMHDRLAASNVCGGQALAKAEVQQVMDKSAEATDLLVKKIASLEAERERAEDGMAALRRDLAQALDKLKENVAREQTLKARFESQEQTLQDRELEHQQQVRMLQKRFQDAEADYARRLNQLDESVKESTEELRLQEQGLQGRIAQLQHVRACPCV